MLFALGLWAMYLCFTKMNIYFTVFAVLTVAALYVVHTYAEHYKAVDPEGKKDTIDTLGTASTVLTVALVGGVLIGFASYFSKQYADHGGDGWSAAKFLFGVPKCASLA